MHRKTAWKLFRMGRIASISMGMKKIHFMRMRTARMRIPSEVLTF